MDYQQVSVCPEMRNFLQDRGMREFNPQEYCMYFEDLNLRMTMRLEKITISGQALVKNFVYLNACEPGYILNALIIASIIILNH